MNSTFVLFKREKNFPLQAEKIRPIPELAGYRIPGIDGIYYTGTEWHCYGLAQKIKPVFLGADFFLT